jgi:hypothetical protein
MRDCPAILPDPGRRLTDRRLILPSSHAATQQQCESETISSDVSETITDKGTTAYGAER